MTLPSESLEELLRRLNAIGGAGDTSTLSEDRKPPTKPEIKPDKRKPGRPPSKPTKSHTPESFKHPSTRDTEGKFVGRPTEYKQPNAEGFKAFLKIIKPRVLTRSGKYEVFTLTERQETVIDKLLAVDDRGNFKRSIGLLVWPRRHGKSTLLALIVIWLLVISRNWTCQLQGNTEQHSRRVQFNQIARIIKNTPELRRLIGEDSLMRSEINYRKCGNVIQSMTSNTLASSFGDRLNVLWVSDLHANADLASFNALQASMLDSSNTLLLIDSNVDAIDGHVHGLQKQAQDDQGIFADHLQYRDYEDYHTNAPLWIDRIKAKRLQRTLLPSEFDRDILGKRSQAQNSLFEIGHIKACQQSYTAPVIDLRAITQGRSYKIGAGLDRAKSLLGEASGGDNSIFSVVAKVARLDGEPEIIVLDQQHVVPNTASMIKALIRKAHEQYRLNNFVIEDYQAVDIEPWCLEQNINCELVSAHSTRQNAMFPELARIVREGRLKFPAHMKELSAEMQSFQYTMVSGGKYSFGAAGSGHDDRVYSLGWSIYALRNSVICNYTLGNIICDNTRTRQHCFLLGGTQQLYCSGKCQAFGQVDGMLREFKRFNTESHLNVMQFYKSYVKVTGVLIVQGV